MAGPRRKTITAAVLVAALASPVAFGQGEDDLRAEIEALKKGQEAIARELQEIKRLLQARQAPAGPQVKGKVFDLGDNLVKGSSEAELILVEFTDYQCPFCSRHVQQTHPQIAATYIDTGKIRFATLDLPLEQLHPLAFKAAEATHCAQEQDRFWEMHDRLFNNQKTLEPWSGHAEALDLDVSAFEACMTSGRYKQAVQRDMAEAAKAGATGTPSFVLAKVDPQDPSKVEGIAFIRGARQFNAFKTEIDKALQALAQN